jgi:sigma-E factor negative regulatory protein RseA
MELSKMTREQISALADGELADAHIDIALAALRGPDGRVAWDAYHEIGDILRSDDMAVALSPNFAARMAARLAAEPAIIAAPLGIRPGLMHQEAVSGNAPQAKNAIRRFAMPGMVAAAVAAFAFIATPQLMVAMKGHAPADNAQSMVASASKTASTVSHASVAAATAQQVSASSSHAAREEIVLRDQGIDEYLLAHQRFSPSVYSTAQFARSATFATDSDK